MQLEPSATSLKFTSYLNANLYLSSIDDVVFETSVENLRSKQKVSCHSWISDEWSVILKIDNHTILLNIYIYIYHRCTKNRLLMSGKWRPTKHMKKQSKNFNLIPTIVSVSRRGSLRTEDFGASPRVRRQKRMNQVCSDVLLHFYVVSTFDWFVECFASVREYLIRLYLVLSSYNNEY